MQADSLVPAFSDPVVDSQRVFRVLLKALSEPGLIHEVDFVDSLGPLDEAAYALALTLLDSSTTVWLSPNFESSLIRQNLTFHCGCRFVAEPEQAMFAFLTADEVQVLRRLNIGTDRDPEFSATAIVQLNTLESGESSVWSGPGIEHSRDVHLPLPTAFWTLREQVNPFPRGVDLFFVAQKQVMGMSRTTQVQTKRED